MPNQRAVVRLPGSTRRDAVRNYQRVLDAAREVIAQSGADASIEEIAARAGVGIGTIYRRFGSKDALLDELGRLALEKVTTAAEEALAMSDGSGLEHLLYAIGQSFVEHARYANLLLERGTDDAAGRRVRAVIDVLRKRAAAAGRINATTTTGDVRTLIWAMRGLIQVVHEEAPEAWQRFLELHLAGMRAKQPPSRAPLTSRQLARLSPRSKRT